jgi:membrane associated rhomboid family serine protease
MAINVNLIDPVSVLAIAVMVASLVIAHYKKWMMTYALIIGNVIIFVITIATQQVPNNIGSSPIIQDLAFRPIYLTVENSPQIYTFFTSMFVHGGFLHLFGNMLIFFFIGMAFEERIGAKNFIIIYLVAGVCGTLAHSLLNLGSDIPLIGASGAIFGIMGAFAFSYPRDKVVMPIGIGIMFLAKIKVIYAVIFWSAVETALIWWESASGTVSSTAHFAHLGGLIGGMVLATILLRGRKTHTPKGETIYYDPYNPQKPEKLDLSELDKLADTTELKQMLAKIKSESVPQVRGIWLEHFFEKARCPKCSSDLKHFDRRVWCEHCGFKEKY